MPNLWPRATESEFLGAEPRYLYFFNSSESNSDSQKPEAENHSLNGQICFIFINSHFFLLDFFHQARQCCDEGECLLANQEIDKFQSKEDAQKALQDIENFLEMALPFINYEPETLQYEFDVILSPELKVEAFKIFK